MSDPALASIEEAPKLSLGSELCTSCGLCCAGALHKAAVLDPDEVDEAIAIGLPVIPDEKPLFALPCPKLVGACCSIYGNRPRVCARYKCRLLQELEAGAVELGPAMEKVSVAKELAQQFLAVMPRGTSLPAARSLASRPASAAQPGSAMLARLRAIALQVYLDKNFRNERDGALLAVNLVKQAPSDRDMT